MATTTASLAYSTVPPLAHHGVNVVNGSMSGLLSASGSGLALLAKIPRGAKNIALTAFHSSGATTQVLNYGLRHGLSASTSFSAFGELADSNGGTFFVESITMEETVNEAFKYVVASRQSGTATTSLVIR